VEAASAAVAAGGVSWFVVFLYLTIVGWWPEWCGSGGVSCVSLSRSRNAMQLV